jgi:hypothetical protein
VGKEPQLLQRKMAFGKAVRRSLETCSGGRAGAHPYRRQRSGSVLLFLLCITCRHAFRHAEKEGKKSLKCFLARNELVDGYSV